MLRSVAAYRYGLSRCARQSAAFPAVADAVAAAVSTNYNLAGSQSQLQERPSQQVRCRERHGASDCVCTCPARVPKAAKEQAKVLNAFLGGRDVVAALPTGCCR